MNGYFGKLTADVSPAVGIIQDGALAHCNAQAAGLLDLDCPSAAGLALEQVFHPGDLESLKGVQRRVMSGPGGMEVHPVRILTGRGEARQVEMATIAFEWKDKPATLNFFRAADQPLTGAPAQRGWMNLDNILNTINDVVYRLDREGHITYVNNVVRHYGYSPEELIGRLYTELVHPDDRDKIAGGPDDRRSPANSARYFSIRLMCPNHPDQTGCPGPLSYRRFLVWVEDIHVTDAAGVRRFLGSQGCAREITASRINGESEALWAAAAEHATEAMIIFDADWNVVDANPAALSLFGRESSKRMLACASEVLGLDLDQARESLAGGGEWLGTMSTSAAGGRRGGVQICSAPVEDCRGHLTHVVAVIRDMNQEQQLNENLCEVHKGEIIIALASGIAHNFNNILTTINGYNELSLSRLDQGNPIRPYLERVAQATTRAEESVKEILALCLSREQERRLIELIPLVREGITLLQTALPSTVTIKPDLGVESDLVQADPTRIKQVLISLGTKVAEAMGQNGGVLEVALSEVEVAAWPVRGNAELEPGSYLRLSVGVAVLGLDSDHGDRQCEPLSSPPESRPNTASALHLAKHIVRSHGGDVVAENRPGRGVTFHVYLPRTGLSPHTVRMIEKPAVGDTTRVLFVDDDEFLVDVGRQMLARLGCQVTACQSSVKALEAFRASPQNFDLVLTDQSMPQLTGLGLAVEIQRIRPELPVILCTGFNDEATLKSLNQPEIAAVITKPLNKRKLSDTIKRVLEASS